MTIYSFTLIQIKEAESLEELFLSKLSESRNFKESKGVIIYNLAYLYMSQEEFEKSLKCINRVLEYAQITSSPSKLSYFLYLKLDCLLSMDYGKEFTYPLVFKLHLICKLNENEPAFIIFRDDLLAKHNVDMKKIIDNYCI